MSRPTLSTQSIALRYRSGACSSKIQISTRGHGVPDKISVLWIPNGIDHGSTLEGARQVRGQGEIPDVVVLTEANAAGLMANYLPPSTAAIVPVIDASGEDHCESASRCEFADLRVKAANSFSLHDIEANNRPGSRLGRARSCSHRPENNSPR